MKIKKGSKLITLIGLCLFVFMLSSLLMMSKTLQNSELFDRFYLALLLFNTLGLVSLSILIILNLKRLIHQLKNRVIGSRMTVRIVILFSLLSVTPVLVVYYFSLDFLHRGRRQHVEPRLGPRVCLARRCGATWAHSASTVNPLSAGAPRLFNH